MKVPHVLRVDGEPAAFAPLVAAMEAAGLRAGWLDLVAPSAASDLAPSDAAPSGLAAAASAGVRRAVSAGGGRTLMLKPLRGEPVLRDLLREHFLGCTLVLLRGAEAATGIAPAPALAADGDGWRLMPLAGDGTRDAAPQHFDTAALVARLRRPHPWGPAAAVSAPEAVPPSPPSPPVDTP
jgi:hypothetical protein